jgi:hypothetical protein
MRGKVKFALVVVAVHLLVAAAHGQAHGHLMILLTSGQEWFVFAAVLLGPVTAAAMMLRGKWRRAGGWLLFLCMGAALAFGAYHHFVAAGADNVANVAAGGWGTTFHVTAALLAAMEAIGCIAGAAVMLDRAK